MVSGQDGSRARWYQGKMVSGQDGSRARWYQGKTVSGQDGIRARWYPGKMVSGQDGIRAGNGISKTSTYANPGLKKGYRGTRDFRGVRN